MKQNKWKKGKQRGVKLGGERRYEREHSRNGEGMRRVIKETAHKISMVTGIK